LYFCVRAPEGVPSWLDSEGFSTTSTSGGHEGEVWERGDGGDGKVHFKRIQPAGLAMCDDSARWLPVPGGCCIWVERGPHGVAVYAGNARHAIVERNHDWKGVDRGLEDPPDVPG